MQLSKRFNRWFLTIVAKITLIEWINETLIEATVQGRVRKKSEKQKRLFRKAWGFRERKHARVISDLKKAHNDDFEDYTNNLESIVNSQIMELQKDRKEIERERDLHGAEKKEMDQEREVLSDRKSTYDRLHRQIERILMDFSKLAVKNGDLKQALIDAGQELKSVNTTVSDVKAKAQNKITK